MQLFLIRHAQSTNNANPVELRVEDPPLTDLGCAQSELLAQHVAALGLTHLITSPFRRALQTAEHVRRATGLVPDVRVDLHEKGGCVRGIDPPSMVGCPGLSRREILAEFPGYAVEARIDGDGWWKSQPYERDAEARARAARLLAQTRAEFATSDHRVAYVMHGDFGLLLLRCLVELPLVLMFNASVTALQITPHRSTMVDFNSVLHLPQHMLSW